MARAPRFIRTLTCLAGLLLFTLAAAQGLYAQVDTGAVLGTVKDQSGAVIPNAKVSLTNEGTNFTIFTVTGVDGGYIFTPVKIGKYTVTTEAAGFRKETRLHIELNVQQQVVVDFELAPGQLVQTVEVTAAPPLLQTQSGSAGQVVNSKAMNDLPLNGRNFTFLAQLTAGVAMGQHDTRGLEASGSFSANGMRPAQNNYLLDGIDNNIDVVDFLNGTAFVVLPSVDAIQEFKVQTSAYSAEIGRAGGAVLNASIKSGTNSVHGNAWEFLRNDKFDAADFFQNAGGVTKGKFRQNQFGFTIGGPAYIPRLFNGKNKTFFFGDYQGTRVRQATPFTTTVPTVAERNSNYTDFSDLIAGSSGTKGPDLLGRTVPTGTVFDPATTRAVTKGVVDPVTGLTATDTGFVRDRFPGNQVLLGRLDPNAIKLLNLLPPPSTSAVFDNLVTSPVKRDNANSFDVRVDQNFSERDTMFARVSYYDEPQFKPGPFSPSVADGGDFAFGNQIATSRNAALSETHSFSATTINEARFGFSGIHTGRLQPFGSDTSNIPAQFGIQGIPQVDGNGGLPELDFGGLSRMGGKDFLISDEFNSTVQLTENLTKIYNAHTFKGGVEFQHIKFSTLQPPYSRGQFNFDGRYTQIPNKDDNNTGRVQLLLTPIRATVPNGVDFVGGPNQVQASNIANTDNGRNYYGLYFQDDWKIKPKLTLNLGLRWDHFGQVEENFGAQANFIPGTPFSGAQYLIPVERKKDPLSTGLGGLGFTNLLAQDGIQLVYSDNFALGMSQKTNFAPRVGFAYQATPKLVVRGGYGIFYGGFENRGYSPNIGENYPFQFNFNFTRTDDAHPVAFADGANATFETGFTHIQLDPSIVKAFNLTLRGIQFDYITPYTQGGNLTVQYQLTTNNAFEVGYVTSLARHLEVFPGANRVSQILPAGTATHPSDVTKPSYIPFRDFAEGSNYAATEGNAYYHSLQTKFTRRFSAGLDFLAAYTYSKARSDAGDLLNGGSIGYRAQYVPGFGIQGDYALADADIRNVIHFSGGYQLPIGRGRHFMNDSGGIANAILGGWSTNWILTLQDGQPQTIGCSTGQTSGTGCVALLVPGQDKNNSATKQETLNYYNFAAFADPPAVTSIGQSDLSPLGGQRGQVVGPGFHRLDWSMFKQIKTSERTHLEFRAEFFNLANHPNFSQPGSFNFKDTKNFAKITSTRDNPNDPRQIQFALKFYF